MPALLQLQGQLPEWMKLPSSVALPYGSFDAALDDPCNASAAESMRRAVAAASGDPSPAALRAVRCACPTDWLIK